MEKALKISNEQIYIIAEALASVFSKGDQYLPAKVAFYIQKNYSLFQNLNKDIEAIRLNIAGNYGIYDEKTNQYHIPPEKIEEAQKELTDLFELEQEVKINTISLKDIESLNFTISQMQAILFMIEEE